MIALLTGRLAFKAPTHLVLDVQGVGYEVFIPLSSYYGLPNLSENTSLSVHTHVREDAIQTLRISHVARERGFCAADQRVRGRTQIGAQRIVGSSSVRSGVGGSVRKCRKADDVPGIGNKSASRLVLELKDKVGKLHPGLLSANDSPGQGQDVTFDDALSALVNLGYRPQDAKDALKQVKNCHPESMTLKDMIRESLKELAQR